MKRLVLSTAIMMGVALAAAPKAEAALAYSYVVCQGALGCSAPIAAVPVGPNWAAGGTYGDYTWSALGSGTEGNPTSSSAVSTTTVTRDSTPQNASALDVYFIVANYTIPTGPQYNLDVSLGATEATFGSSPSRDLVTFQAWFSSTNSLAIPPTGSASLLASCTPVMSAGTDSCNSNPGGTLVGPGSANFSLITRTSFFITSGNTTQFGTSSSANLTAVPEPGSMMLLGTGLLGLAAIARRRSVRR